MEYEKIIAFLCTISSLISETVRDRPTVLQIANRKSSAPELKWPSNFKGETLFLPTIHGPPNSAQ